MFDLDFLCIGPQRSGTTWLDKVMRMHSGVALPRETKETFFFDQQYSRGWDWYASHFASTNAQLCGEIAPSYFDVSAAVERVRSHCPRTLIVVMLREPVARAISSFHHHARLGQCSTDFDQAVLDVPKITESSLYSKYLPRWIDAFGQDRILPLISEDISDCPNALLEGLVDFLEIDSFPVGAANTAERVNSTSFPRFPVFARFAAQLSKFAKAHRLHKLVNAGKAMGLKAVFRGGEDKLPAVSIEQRARLQDLFAAQADYVERLTGRSLPQWRTSENIL